MKHKKEIKAWAMVDKITGNILRYDRNFQDIYLIHPTRQRARNCLSDGIKIVRCIIKLK